MDTAIHLLKVLFKDLKQWEKGENSLHTGDLQRFTTAWYSTVMKKLQSDVHSLADKCLNRFSEYLTVGNRGGWRKEKPDSVGPGWKSTSGSGPSFTSPEAARWGEAQTVICDHQWDVKDCVLNFYSQMKHCFTRRNIYVFFRILLHR